METPVLIIGVVWPWPEGRFSWQPHCQRGCLWNQALLAFKECCKAQLSHQLWKHMQYFCSHSISFGAWWKSLQPSPTKTQASACMEREFLVSRMLAAVFSIPKSAYLISINHWFETYQSACALQRITFSLNSVTCRNYLGTLSVFLQVSCYIPFTFQQISMPFAITVMDSSPISTAHLQLTFLFAAFGSSTLWELFIS